MDSKDEREKRLAEALRANLRRRKAQAREGVPAVIEGVVENGGSPDDKASDDA